LRIDPAERGAQIIVEVDLVHAQLRALIDTLNGRPPSKAAKARARELRLKLRALTSEADSLLLHEEALEIAVRSRLGRTDVEGQEILLADEEAADKILRGLGLC
jgi:hypothetical protein